MNFFKAAFFEKEEPSSSRNSEENLLEEHEETLAQENSVSGGRDSGVWNFGGLVKALTSKSEEVIEAYKRDLEEFKSGLKKETEVIKEVASRAVKDLPNSLEVGASVAQESLESVGQAIDEFGSTVWRGTSEIISEGKDLISKLDEENNNNNNNDQVESLPSSSVYDVRKYNRFEVQVRGMQLDSNTYCREPEDVEDFEAWKKEFSLEEREEEIEDLCTKNAFMEEVRARLVPSIVDNESFWMRYFYRLHRLKQAEEARVDLVKRAMISQEEEEELSWEVDDEEEEEIGVKNENKNTEVKISKEMGEKSIIVEKTELEGNSAESLNKTVQMAAATQENVARPLQITEDVAGKQGMEEVFVEMKSDDNVDKKPKYDEVKEKVVEDDNDEKSKADEVKEKVAEDENDEKSKADEGERDETFMEAKTDPAESSKSSDFSIVSSKPSCHDEDDLGWDEIEDLSAVDERKLSAGGSPHRADIRKRISAIEDDEDLSWDVDDDEDVKS